MRRGPLGEAGAERFAQDRPRRSSWLGDGLFRRLLQNAGWLLSGTAVATALGLGFQLVSAVQTMGESREFMELAGIPYGEFEVDGCAVGYPDQEPAERSMVEPAQLTKWL